MPAVLGDVSPPAPRGPRSRARGRRRRRAAPPPSPRRRAARADPTGPRPIEDAPAAERSPQRRRARRRGPRPSPDPPAAVDGAGPAPVGDVRRRRGRASPLRPRRQRPRELARAGRRSLGSSAPRRSRPRRRLPRSVARPSRRRPSLPRPHPNGPHRRCTLAAATPRVAAGRPSGRAPAPPPHAGSAAVPARGDPRRRRSKGTVRARLTIDAAGRVTNVAIVDAQPRRVFDRAVTTRARRAGPTSPARPGARPRSRSRSGAIDRA